SRRHPIGVVPDVLPTRVSCAILPTFRRRPQKRNGLAMRTRIGMLLVALLIAAPLAAIAAEKVAKPPRKTAVRPRFVPMDFAKMFSAGPLSDPQPPSTLLPAGATTVELTLRAATPTVCRYSVGQDRPLDEMTPFDTKQPSASPKTVIRGLDPDPSKV